MQFKPSAFATIANKSSFWVSRPTSIEYSLLKAVSSSDFPDISNEQSVCVDDHHFPCVGDMICVVTAGKSALSLSLLFNVNSFDPSSMLCTTYSSDACPSLLKGLRMCTLPTLFTTPLFIGCFMLS